MNTETMYQAGAQAALDTAGLAITNTVITGASRLASWAGEQASQSGWTRTGQALSWLGGHSSAAVFATSSYSHGVVEAGVRMASGVVAEEAVVQTGKLAIGLFGKQDSSVKPSEAIDKVGQYKKHC